MPPPSLFTRIIRRELPADILHEDDHCIAIRDINPRAPVHILLIPKPEIPRLADATPDHQKLLGHLLLTASQIAQQHGIGDAFRLIINNGEGAGQTVFHLHLHILGGQKTSEASLGF
ncbi:MAG: histidine triad nucleotide-binding protein [Cellvibrionales bacterium]|nr:histidine triad nucleotide-binding protein [Cellvibrionales bacterium]